MLKSVFIAVFLITTVFSGTAQANAAETVVTPWTQKHERLSGVEKPDPVFEDSDELDNEDLTARKDPKRSKGTASGIKKILSVPSQKENKPSALEKMYADRVVDQVEQFGYDLFGVPGENMLSQLDNAGSSMVPMGEVQDDFILSSGDELEIVFTGQHTAHTLYKINSRGILLIPDLPPIPAEGRTIGQVRVSVQAAASNLYNTETYVSLASVRQIGVLVIGHVKKPGRQTVTVFHTLIDALMAAGGIEKTGSLRQVKLVRQGRSMMVDLYGLLMHGSPVMDLRLKDGDRIIIPAIGPTVAIAGEIKRPGIYEILPAVGGTLHKPESHSEKLSLNEMLELGGGVMAPGQNRFLKLEVTSQGKENISEIHEDSAVKPSFGDGSVLMISKSSEKHAGSLNE